MKLSYLIKPCTPVWARIIEPVLPQHDHSDEHTHNYGEHIDCSRDNQSDINHKYHHNHTSGDPDISSIHANAGEVKPGGLFIAVKGFKADGHDYIGQAVENGASAIVVERKIDKKELAALFSSSLIKPAVVEVQDTRKAMSAIAARFYGNPSDAMVLVGVTGTNGKTTTAFLIESIFKAAGYNTGVIGTVNYRFGDKVFDNPVTTPDSIDLHRILAQMRDAGVTHVVMEVSSHAVDLHRVRDCEFDVGVFTNLTQDHLDYHKTMSAYFACKKSFFTRQLKKGKKGGKSVAVINIDDSYGVKIAAELGSKAITTAISADKDKSITPQISSSSIKDDISGLKGDIQIQISNTAITNTAVNRNSSGDLSDSFSFSSKLTGQFNLENILSAAGASYAVGISLKTIAKGIEACNGVPGRLERVEADGKKDSSVKRHVFVDYAHTPDALDSILKTLKMRAPARLISVFGCGGDRDKTKRPIMGEIAYRYSDITIVTSDNPRTEEPNSIIRQIVKGIEDAKSCLNMENAEKSDRNNIEKQVIVEPDRAAALSLAIKISQPNDIIVAAGKGHETYQITAQGKIDFDDRIILKNALTILNTEKAVDVGKETQIVSKAGDGEKEPQLVPIEWSVSDITTALGISAPLEISSPVNLPLSEDSKPDLNLSSHKFSSVSTDSRTIKNGELFVALRGDRFDGHKFVFNLIEQGVKGFVVGQGFYDDLSPDKRDEINKNNIYLFEVADTLKALGMLARFQRVRSGVKVVAITGSNGKTTTRKMTASIFEQHFKTLSTQGNLNNEIGVPLTLLKLSKDHDWAVVEMGMNHPGEISRLSRIACPDIAIITNTTDAHLEGLGSVEAVAMAKSEITDGMNQGSTIIINRDDPRWKIISDKADKSPNVSAKIFFGLD
ncbi:MAG: UDP-N-acetylmuramoyl-L-alanyl-D-glutamate--2,6-diaminopimelate ligase, partial [Desulfamplus sp.]